MAELVAKTYAKAMFESALEENALNTVIAEFERFMPMYEEAKGVLRAPTVSDRDKRALLETMQLEGLFRSFVFLLLEKDRLHSVHEIKRHFDDMAEEHGKIARAYVQSAVPLEEGQIASLKERLEKSTGYTIKIESEVRPEIIGGIVVRIGDKVLDGSVRSKLDNMLESIREIR